jgi:two-component system chemotaxis response regulator CheB
MRPSAVTSPPKNKPPAHIIAIGASAGGVSTLIRLLPELPLIPDCCLLIVVHLAATNRSMLPQILRRIAHWKVKPAEEGEPICAGTAYIAVPGFHLVLSGGELHLSSANRVHLQRPSVDVLFASVAKEQGQGSIGVLLSGSGSDGSDGLRLMKLSGAQTIVQDPAEAMFPSMPEHGILTGCADFIIPAHSIAPKLSMLCQG